MQYDVLCPAYDCVCGAIIVYRMAAGNIPLVVREGNIPLVEREGNICVSINFLKECSGSFQSMTVVFVLM